MVNLTLIITSSIAVASCAALWILDLANGRRCEEQAPAPKRYVRGMREREYIRLIPEDEMQRLKALLHRIYKARGWSTDDSSRSQAWSSVVAAAQMPEGGSWRLDFSPDDVNPEQLEALYIALESSFLGGLLSAEIQRRKRPPIKVILAVDPNNPNDWLSGLHDDNTIFVNARSWNESISEANPMNFEGTWCHSKLEALAHTLGHELVHATVLNFFPDMDAYSAAYTPDDKHGPVFMYLNKRLLGHTGHASHRLFNIAD